MNLSNRYEQAFCYAAQLHAAQMRKGGGVPYLSHLMSVSALVMEHGGSEDQAIAGFLHDAAEDQGGRTTLEDIRRQFGDTVADIVEACTDSWVEPKPPWRKRKEAYLDKLGRTNGQALLVVAADKLHNARCVLRDMREVGGELWSKFRGGRDGSLWYYRELADLFAEVGPRHLAAELERTVTEIERLAEAQVEPSAFQRRGAKNAKPQKT